MKSYFGKIPLLLIIIWGFVGCGIKNPLPTVSPVVSPLQSPDGIDASMAIDDVRSETALTALPIAELRAREWKETAMLYGIFPSFSMEVNLGLPTVSAGWFFMFKEQDSPVEFYVQILDGKISGTTEAQAILGEQLPYRYLPIEIATLSLDSDDVLRAFAARGVSDYVRLHPDSRFDYRLVHLKGQEHPVWSLYGVADSELQSLIHLDAVTGVEVQDPFASVE